MAVYGEGFEYVGDPTKLDWGFMKGARILAHNAAFDWKAVQTLRQRGTDIPEPALVEDTADLAAYCGCPRALAAAAYHLWRFTHDKTIRDKDMKGKSWKEMTPELREAVKAYALEDCKLTMRLWDELNDRWPEAERLTSRLTRQWADTGVAVDEKAIEDAIGKLKTLIWESSVALPWVAESGAPPLSPKELAIACRKVGITPPKSLAIGDEEAETWMETYGDRYPWVKAMRDWRRANAILKKLEAIKTRTFGGRLRYEIKTYGAGMTLRWSGAGGVNVQNLSGKTLYGVNMRDMIIAEPGNVLIAADLAQIEPRVACFLARETDALQQMAGGTSPYTVYARQAMGLGANEEWPKSDSRYKIAKMSVLGASYCAGHHRFRDLLRATGMEDVLENGPEHEDTTQRYQEYLAFVKRPEWFQIWEEADSPERKKLLRSWEIIQQFRAGRPKLVRLWADLRKKAEDSANSAENLELSLPSGRTLTYKHLRWRERKGRESEIVGDIIRNGAVQTTRLHQGIFIENLCQSLARDVFRDCLLAVHEAGHRIVLHVHDELVVEVREDEAEKAKQNILAIMSRSPEWGPSLPIEAEATIAKKYSQAK